MVFVVLVMPWALLGALFGMNVVERWVEAVVPVRTAQPDAIFVPQQRRPLEAHDPVGMVSREAAGQAL